MKLITHLSTPWGWKAELALLADLQRTVYPYKWLPISCRSGADQWKFADQRLTFYHWATEPTVIWTTESTHPVSCFKWLATLDQNAVDSADTSADHDGCRCRQTKCTRTRDTQHWDGVLERLLNHQLMKIPSALQRQQRLRRVLTQNFTRYKLINSSRLVKQRKKSFLKITFLYFTAPDVCSSTGKYGIWPFLFLQIW